MGWTREEFQRPYWVGHKLETGHETAERTARTAVERQDHKICINFNSELQKEVSSR